MQNNSAEFLQKIAQAKQDLVALPHSIYTPQDVSLILSAVGIKLELFLKAVIFPMESPWRPFKYFVNQLDGIIAPEKVQQIQDFRELYNLARHNPRFSIGVIELRESLDILEANVAEIIDLEIGRSGDPLLIPTKRVYWVSAWQYFDNIEVQVMIPSHEETGLGPPELDMIRIDGSAWESVKQVLTTAGKIDYWTGYIPESLVTTWQKCQDFVEVIAFEGEYRELLTNLAMFETCNTRMPGSSRSDCSQHVLVACLVALADVSASNDSTEGLVSELTKQAVSSYAIRSTATDLTEIASDLAQLVNTMDEGDHLEGPLWANNQEFEAFKQTALAVSNKYPVLIDNHHRLIALHG